jgi:hypothetical protein
MLGLLPTGPSHAVFGLAGASPIVRVLSPLTILSCAAISVLPFFLRRLLGRRESYWTQRRSVFAAAALAITAAMPVLLMGQMSEVHLMGPNLAAASLLALGVLDGWNLLLAARATVTFGRWRIARVVYITVTVAAVSLCLFGLVSRSRHIALNWLYGAELFRMIGEHQESLPASAKPALVSLTPACDAGRVYSQIVIPPRKALVPSQTLAWFNHQRPERPLALVRGDALVSPRPGDLVLTCGNLPARPLW